MREGVRTTPSGVDAWVSVRWDADRARGRRWGARHDPARGGPGDSAVQARRLVSTAEAGREPPAVRSDPGSAESCARIGRRGRVEARAARARSRAPAMARSSSFPAAAGRLRRGRPVELRWQLAVGGPDRLPRRPRRRDPAAAVPVVNVGPASPVGPRARGASSCLRRARRRVGTVEGRRPADALARHELVGAHRRDGCASISATLGPGRVRSGEPQSPAGSGCGVVMEDLRGTGLDGASAWSDFRDRDVRMAGAALRGHRAIGLDSAVSRVSTGAGARAG